MSSYPPQQACPRCRYALPPGATVCPSCGLALASAPPAAGAVPPAGPQAYGNPVPGGENFGAPNFADPFTFGLGNQPFPGPAGAPGAQQSAPSGGFSTVAANPVQPGPSGGFSTVSNPQIQPGTSGGFAPVPGNPAQPGISGGFPQPGPSGTFPAFAGGQQAPAFPAGQPSSGVMGNPSAPSFPAGQPFPGYQGQPPQPGPSGTLPGYPGAPAGVSNPPVGFSSPAASYPGAPGSFASTPAGFPGAPANYPGAPGQPPFGGPFPPGPGMAPPARPSHRGRNIALLAIILVVIIGGASGITYVLTRPKPVISVTSQYTSGSTLVGSASTVFRIRGSQFSSNSTITFLLDGKQTPGNQTVVSDNNGAFAVNLTVTAEWVTGTHTLTARDAGGYQTNVGKAILIVNQGEAGTPGPKGAPADDTQLFALHVTVQRQGLQDASETLTVTGQPDPAGGTVCNKSRDDGQPHSATSSDGQGGTITETIVLKCSGTYKAGKITYTETVNSDKAVFSSGRTCTLVAPFNDQQLTGSFTDATHASGTFSSDAAIYTCNQGGGLAIPPDSGTWTGTSS